MKYVYFVSFTWGGSSGGGTGNCDVPVDTEIKSIVEIREMEQNLKTKYKLKYEWISITFYTLLRIENV